MPRPRRLPLPSRFPIYYGWVILPMASIALLMSGPGQTFSFSVFVQPMRDELGLSQTAFASLYTAGSLAASGALILVGRLLDRLGARVMLTAVGVLLGLGALWMSRVDNQGELFIGIALMRLLGQGSMHLIGTTLVAMWFIRRRGRAIAIVSLGSAISQAAFPPLIVLLIASLGWRDAWAALALVVWGAIVLPSALLVRRSPESVQLLPDGGRVASSGTGPHPDSPGVTEETNYSLSQAMATRAFWLLVLSVSAHGLIGTALMFNNESLFASKGLDAIVAASVFPVMAPMILAGNFFSGFLADRYPNRYQMAGSQLLLAIPMLWTFFISEPWHALIYGLLLGLAGGFFTNVNAVIWANYYGRQHLGSIRGVVTTAIVGAAALGPLPFAFLSDLSGGYTLPIQVFLVFPVLAAIAALAAVPSSSKRSAPRGPS